MGGPGSGRRKAIKRDTAVPPTDEPIEAAGTDLLKPLPRVTQPTGGTIEVQDDLEKTFYDGQHAKYLEENKFTSSDLTDLDSLLLQELLDYRWTRQLASLKDYDGRFLSVGAEEQLRRNKNDAARIVSGLKVNLGLTRASRNAQEASTSEYLNQLRIRAKEFGIHRNTQAVSAITLMNELSSIVGTYDRANETERRKVGFESELEIVAWVRDKMIPKFRKIDEEFRKTQQRYWVGTL